MLVYVPEMIKYMIPIGQDKIQVNKRQIHDEIHCGESNQREKIKYLSRDNNQTTADFSKAKISNRNQWTTFREMNENKCQSRIIYPPKLLFDCQGYLPITDREILKKKYCFFEKNQRIKRQNWCKINLKREKGK